MCIFSCTIVAEIRKMENAVSEDRAHDLRIMRPTRYQLRYHRLILIVRIDFHTSDTWCKVIDVHSETMRIRSCGLMDKAPPS